MAQKDVLRLLRNLSKHAALWQSYNSSEAERKKIIDESGGISAAEKTMLLGRDKKTIMSYLNEDEATAQQIQRV
jgi:hypothetical protein